MGWTIARVVGAAAGGLLALFAVFTWAFRTKFAPVQDRIRRFNRGFTNPRQLRTAGRPGASASVVEHVGRHSGTTYRTPVVAVPDGERFLFALPYGRGADWVRNVVAAGRAVVHHEGEVVDVEAPRFLDRASANPRFAPGEQRLHHVFGVDDFLVLERRDPGAAEPGRGPAG